MIGYAAQDEQVGQDVNHVVRLQLAPDPDGQALMGVLRQAQDEVVHDFEGRNLRPSWVRSSTKS